MKNRTTSGLICVALVAGACQSKPQSSEAPPSMAAEPLAAKTDPGVSTQADRTKPAIGAGYELDKPKAVETAAPSAAALAKEAAGQAAAGTNAVQGPVISGEGFSVYLQAPRAAVAGEPSQAEVVLSAQAPFHCNDKYPYKLVLEPSTGISYPEQTVRKIAIGEQTSTMAVPFTASSPGKHTLSGELSFSVCTDDKCLVEKQKLSVTIDVKGKS